MKFIDDNYCNNPLIKKMQTKLIDSSNIFSWTDSIEKFKDFDRLIDWLSVEFILYQQEDNLGLKVYFPNGWLVVHYLEGIDNKFEVLISSKSKISLMRIKKQLSMSIHRFKQLKTDYSYE